MSIYDVIVIGTGAGGATVAKDLSLNSHKILILDRKFSEEWNICKIHEDKGNSSEQTVR